MFAFSNPSGPRSRRGPGLPRPAPVPARRSGRRGRCRQWRKVIFNAATHPHGRARQYLRGSRAASSTKGKALAAAQAFVLDAIPRSDRPRGEARGRIRSQASMLQDRRGTCPTEDPCGDRPVRRARGPPRVQSRDLGSSLVKGLEQSWWTRPSRMMLQRHPRGDGQQHLDAAPRLRLRVHGFEGAVT